jgi:hypothetical protein
MADDANVSAADTPPGSSGGDGGGLDAAGKDANQNFGSSAVGATVQGCAKKSWIEITLTQGEKPVPGEAYRVELPDGSTKQGDLDANGFARIDGIDPGTCKVSFPDRDGREWKRK